MTNSNTKHQTLVPMLVIGTLFFMFGFVTWLNGALIPFLQIACELNHIQAYLVTMAFYISYTVMALPMSYILRKSGFKNGMVLGLFIMVVGALMFVPAAYTRMYSVFLVGLFILGAGLTILQTASNPYIVLLGPRESAAVRISIMGILNKSAGVVAPLVFTAFVLSDMSQFSEQSLSILDMQQKAAQLNELSSRLIEPYLLMAFMLFLLGVFIKFMPLPSVKAPVDQTDRNAHPVGGIMQKPQVILGALALFFYVGAEVIAGDTIGLFSKEHGVSNFGQMTSYTMVFMVIGYLLGLALIPRFVSQQSALAASAVTGVAFTLLLLNASTTSDGIWSMLFAWTGVPAIPNAVLYVALFGLCNAMVWPAIWPLALKGLNDKDTSTASALLIMGISGGAILPLIYGVLAESQGDAQGAYWLMIPCYLFIAFYALKGHKLQQWQTKA